MIDKVYEIGLLYDFYGQLLTEKQKQVIELYYNEDLSLGEISETMGISRQGVYDLLKRSEKILYDYEKKLGLVEKFQIERNKIKEAYKLLDSIDDDQKINKIKALLSEIIDTNI